MNMKCTLLECWFQQLREVRLPCKDVRFDCELLGWRLLKLACLCVMGFGLEVKLRDGEGGGGGGGCSLPQRASRKKAMWITILHNCWVQYKELFDRDELAFSWNKNSLHDFSMDVLLTVNISIFSDPPVSGYSICSRLPNLPIIPAWLFLLQSN